MRRLTLPLCLLLSTSAAVAERTFHEEVAAAPVLRVDLEAGGEIRVSAWDRDTIAVDATYGGRDAADVRFEVRRVEDAVEIESSYVGSRKSWQTGGRVEIQAPRRIRLDLRTTGGELWIEGIAGDVDAETFGGRVQLADLEGRLDVKTMGGDIRVERSRVSGRVETMGGHISLEQVCGGVEAATMGGNVTFKDVDDACPGECREVRISTMGGNITAPDAPCGADLETMGGNIGITRAGDHVRATTMGGNITVGEVDGWVHATTMGGDIDVRVVGAGGRRDARLDSKGGDVTLRVPADLGMDLDITIFFTKQSRQDFRVETDLPLEIRRSDGWDNDYDPPRKWIRARGRTGSGEHKVKIETVDGDVRLIRD